MTQEIDWRFRLIATLVGPQTPRVLRRAQIADLVREVKSGSTTLHVREAISGLLHCKTISAVGDDLYINLRTLPYVSVMEAAQVIRPGAVVSLISVLGECGFLNNPTRIVTAVIPQDDEATPIYDEVLHGEHEFRFMGLPSRFFPVSDEDDRYMAQQGRFCAVAKPELALLHWIYLLGARSPQQIPILGPIPFDVDFEMLDLDLVRELAARLSLSSQLAALAKRFA